jgi:hypothetical protein
VPSPPPSSFVRGGNLLGENCRLEFKGRTLRDRRFGIAPHFVSIPIPLPLWTKTRLRGCFPAVAYQFLIEELQLWGVG